MKKYIRVSILLAAIIALLCVSAYAADGPSESGIYALAPASGYEASITLEAQNASGTKIEASGLVDETSFYPNAERIKLTYSGANTGSYYLVLAQDAEGVPTEKNIVYIDQTTATDTSVIFNIYPSTLTSGTTYYLYLADSNTSERYLVATFKYYQPYMLGDVDESGYLSPVDALMVLQAITEANGVELSPSQRLAADMNKNGVLEPTDALLILQALTT